MVQAMKDKHIIGCFKELFVIWTHLNFWNTKDKVE